ncbi:MAG: 6,7-dimethyl-8-ribityllumazine synthase [Myxococcota bacterium]
MADERKLLKRLEGHLVMSAQVRVGIVLGRFNEVIGERLLKGAMDTLLRHGVLEHHVTVAVAPGAFEIPLVVKRLAASGKFDAMLALGAVIRGGTPHFEYVCSSVTSGLSSVMMEHDIPVGFGILTTDNEEQALARAGLKLGNKGTEAATAVIEMISLLQQVDQYVR